MSAYWGYIVVIRTAVIQMDHTPVLVEETLC